MEFWLVIAAAFMILGVALLRINGGYPNALQRLGYVFIALSLVAWLMIGVLLIVDFDVF